MNVQGYAIVSDITYEVTIRITQTELDELYNAAKLFNRQMPDSTVEPLLEVLNSIRVNSHHYEAGLE